jgi:hypothetical protein
MWSRKSAMLGSLAVAMYLLGLTLRNSQLVTIAVVIFVFLTWAALFGGHADVASSGRRADEWTGEEGVALGSVTAMRKLSSARIFEDGELNITLRMQNHSSLAKILEVRDRVPVICTIFDAHHFRNTVTHFQNLWKRRCILHSQRYIQFSIFKHAGTGQLSHGDDIAQGNAFLSTPLFGTTTARCNIRMVPKERSPCKEHEDNHGNRDELGVSERQAKQVHGNS